MPIFWRILAAIGGVLVLLLIAVAIAIRTVDVNEFVGPVKQRVKEATGRELTVHGGIDLKLGLTPSLVVDDVSLGNATWAKQPQMVTAKRIEAEIALLPLLKRRFEIVRIKLVEPTIALETDPSGKGNWEFQSASTAANASAPARSGATLGPLVVGDMAISGGVLTYRDGKSGEVTTVRIDELSLHARDAASPVSGRFRGKINDTKVALEGDFGPLDQLLQQRWPYPVTVQGDIDEKKASVSTKMSVQGGAVALDELQLGAGGSRLTGQMTVSTGGARPRLAFKLAATTLALADLAVAAPVKPTATKAPSTSRYVFSEAPLDLAGLGAVDATGELAVDKLTLPDGLSLGQVRVQLALQNGRLDVPVLQAAALGGSAQARLHIDASQPGAPALTAHLDARNLDLAALLELADVHRQVRGGKTEIKADLAAHGVSPHQWASGMSGTVSAIVGPATLANTGTGNSSLERVSEAVNPFRKVDASTELRCAVLRLPLRNGVAAIDRSIGIETDKLGATASGTLDFRSETLDLAIKPQLRQGIALNIDQIATLVRFHGSFVAPAVGIDSTASAKTAATLGAALATGGMSLVGQELLAGATADKGAPCQIALGGGGRGASPEPAPKQQPQQSVPADVSKALGRILGR